MRLLVVGGSLGARGSTPSCRSRWRGSRGSIAFEVRHQAGERWHRVARARATPRPDVRARRARRSSTTWPRPTPGRDLVDLPRRRADRLRARGRRRRRDARAVSRRRRRSPDAQRAVPGARRRGRADRRPRAHRRAARRRAAASCAPAAASCSPWPSARACSRGRAPPKSSPPSCLEHAWRRGMTRSHDRMRRINTHPLRRHRRQRHGRHRRGAGQPRLRGAGLAICKPNPSPSGSRSSARACSFGHARENVGGADVVVVSSAVVAGQSRSGRARCERASRWCRAPRCSAS